MRKKRLIIATRESQLALWQATWAATCIQKIHPEIEIKLLPMSTQADRAPYIELHEIGNKGLFVKELEDALLQGRADIAVHSMKDMPVDLPPGLIIAAISMREDPRDVLVCNQYTKLSELPKGAAVGTSSLRRKTQLLHLRPDLQLAPLRGNVPTRLARLDSGNYAAIMLAVAGLKRLGLTERLNIVLAADEFVPAAGQGALGIECRADDKDTQALVACLNDADTYNCVSAERSLCKQLGAHCQAPVAAYASLEADKIILRGLVASLDGKTVLRAKASGDSAQTQALGIAVGNDLLKHGADKILQAWQEEDA